MLTYRAELRRALQRQQARLWARIEASYDPPARKDAAADGSNLDAPLEFPPAVLDRVGGRVSKKVTDEAKRLGIMAKREEDRATGKRLPGITRAQQGADRAMLDGWRKKNLGLIKTLDGTQRGQLGEVLALATEQGWPIERLRKNVEERFSVTKSHADLIARDQTLKLNAQMTQHRQTSAGIREYIWSTSNDERVRDEHDDLDGERQSWDDPPVVSEDGDRAHPGEYFQCRCVPIAVVPWLEDEDGEPLEEPAFAYDKDQAKATLEQLNDPAARAESDELDGGHWVHALELVLLKKMTVPKVWSPPKLDTTLAKIRAGEKLEPVRVIKEKQGYKIVDGIHRTNASKDAGLKRVPAFVARWKSARRRDELELLVDDGRSESALRALARAWARADGNGKAS